LGISIVSVGINAVLNYGLIHGAFGLPRLGFLGSATATAITVWLTTLTLALMLHARHKMRRFVRFTRPSVPVMRELAGIG
ncbi:hypothetical protein QSI13_24590, partial [Escherichia coli]|nr:hypothetical protein [Escherichia coli]